MFNKTVLETFLVSLSVSLLSQTSCFPVILQANSWKIFGEGDGEWVNMEYLILSNYCISNHRTIRCQWSLLYHHAGLCQNWNGGDSQFGCTDERWWMCDQWRVSGFRANVPPGLIGSRQPRPQHGDCVGELREVGVCCCGRTGLWLSDRWGQHCCKIRRGLLEHFFNIPFVLIWKTLFPVPVWCHILLYSNFLAVPRILTEGPMTPRCRQFYQSQRWNQLQWPDGCEQSRDPEFCSRFVDRKVEQTKTGCIILYFKMKHWFKERQNKNQDSSDIWCLVPVLLEGNPFRQDEEVEQGEDRNRTKRKETAGRQQLQNQQLNGRQPRCQSIMTVGKPVLVTRADTSHLQFVCLFQIGLVSYLSVLNK